MWNGDAKFIYTLDALPSTFQISTDIQVLLIPIYKYSMGLKKYHQLITYLNTLAVLKSRFEMPMALWARYCIWGN